MSDPREQACPVDLPPFMQPLARQARSGRDVLLDRGVHPPRPEDPPYRRSAVLLLITGSERDTAQVLLHERGHALRSQPGQIALPGGGVEDQDADEIATALRESREEVDLNPTDVSVLGTFAPVPMPHRHLAITPVLAWAAEPPAVRVRDRLEVERVLWTPLEGPDGLAAPQRRARGLLDGRPVGPLFDLPDNVLVWGFTAMLLDRVLTQLGAAPVPPHTVPAREIPPRLR